MSRRTKLTAAIASVLAVIAVGGGVIATAGATNASAGNQLAGTWTVTINRPGGLPPLASLQVYTGAESNGRSFTFQGRTTIYDANGNVVVANIPVSGSGERLHVEE